MKNTIIGRYYQRSEGPLPPQEDLNVPRVLKLKPLSGYNVATMQSKELTFNSFGGDSTVGCQTARLTEPLKSIQIRVSQDVLLFA